MKIIKKLVMGTIFLSSYLIFAEVLFLNANLNLLNKMLILLCYSFWMIVLGLSLARMIMEKGK